MPLKLSIIIPIFNVEQYLHECLDSIITQGSNEVEIILVEDGSTDDSLAIANHYINRLKNGILICHSSNMGLGPARNSGLRVAKGEYIAFLDSDDFFSENAISDLLDELQGVDSDLLQMGCNKVHSSHSEVNLYTVNAPQESQSLEDLKKQVLELPSYAWMKIYRAAFLKEQKLEFHNIYYEDIPWSIDCILKSKSIIRTQLCFYNYRQRQGSIVNSVSERHLDMLSAYSLIFQKRRQNKSLWKLERAIDNGFVKSAFYLFRERLSRLGNKSEDKYFENLKKATSNRLVLPTNPKTIAMWLIIYANWLKHYLRTAIRRAV